MLRQPEPPTPPASSPTLRLAVVVLAAGAGSRFSAQPGAKLLADLDGRPILEHVLAAVRNARPVATIVVLGHRAADVERSIRWRDELRVINRSPERGLASSLQVGVQALAALPGSLDGTFVVLGDQPRLRPGVMRRLADAATTAGTARLAALAPRYEVPGPRNPVLLLRPAWAWVAELKGDHGLGPWLDAHPGSVLEVAVEGDMPDVDEPADLEHLRTAPD